MVEYIERAAATQAAIDYFWGTQVVLIGSYGIAKAINNVPSADVAPVVHGRWNINKEGYLECSNCGWVRYGVPLCEHYFYCPNCGAKMDLKVDAE